MLFKVLNIVDGVAWLFEALARKFDAAGTWWVSLSTVFYAIGLLLAGAAADAARPWLQYALDGAPRAVLAGHDAAQDLLLPGGWVLLMLAATLFARAALRRRAALKL
ncbi:MAG: hypothetical protein V4801_05500 [Burkholderia gladioli]